MTETVPSWSDERVDLLRRLWQDGLSASQIATHLGGVSRNAVIGKVHRLGLSGRVAKGPEAALARRKPGREADGADAGTSDAGIQAPEAPEIAGPVAGHREPAAAEPGVAEAARVVALQPEAPAACAAPAPVARVETVGLAASRRVTIMELRESMCRWPLGDPTSPDFHYCGDRAITGLPYCTHHAQIAYQPAAERKRDRRVGGFR